MSDLVRSSMITTDRNVAGDVIKRVQGRGFMCIHLIPDDYIQFLSRLLEGILGTFLGSYFGRPNLGYTV
jgi:hypothetical protein